MSKQSCSTGFFHLSLLYHITILHSLNVIYFFVIIWASHLFTSPLLGQLTVSLPSLLFNWRISQKCCNPCCTPLLLGQMPDRKAKEGRKILFHARQVGNYRDWVNMGAKEEREVRSFTDLPFWGVYEEMGTEVSRRTPQVPHSFITCDTIPDGNWWLLHQEIGKKGSQHMFSVHMSFTCTSMREIGFTAAHVIKMSTRLMYN